MNAADTVDFFTSANGDIVAQEVEMLLRDTRSKGFKDLRDRAAYMYITGEYPSHLRKFFTRALGIIARFHNKSTSMDRRGGGMKLDENVVVKLGLDQHPMVLKTKEYVEQGYKITTHRVDSERKPYTKIFLSRGDTQVTVQIDGSVLDHWG